MTFTALEPKSFDDLLFQTDIARKKLERYARGAATENILLHGPYGSSKTTTAKVVATEAKSLATSIFEFDVVILNGGDFAPEQLAIVERAWQLSGPRYTYAIIDEFDLVRSKDQAKVRALIDKYTGRHGFIFTTNHLHRVDGAIQSRCDVIEMPALDPQKLLPLCKRFLSQARISLDESQITDAIKHERGDIRCVLRQLERIVLEVKERPAA